MASTGSAWRPGRTLEVLQDQVAPRPFAEVELAVQRELGAPIAELFAEFEPAAAAAASLAQARRCCMRAAHADIGTVQALWLPLPRMRGLGRGRDMAVPAAMSDARGMTPVADGGQVHKARLADGREVAVKVQYAGLETAVAAAITTLSLLAAAATRFFPNAFDFKCARLSPPMQPLCRACLRAWCAPFRKTIAPLNRPLLLTEAPDD